MRDNAKKLYDVTINLILIINHSYKLRLAIKNSSFFYIKKGQDPYKRNYVDMHIKYGWICNPRKPLFMGNVF